MTPRLAILRSTMQKFVQPLQKPPVLLGILLAIILFVCFVFQLLPRDLSPMGRSYAYDYFTLPRCGLAIRFGTDPYTSAENYQNYGYFATNWISHPILCVVAGVPLSYLPPWFGFWLMTSLYAFIHTWMIWVFGKHLTPVKDMNKGIETYLISDFVFFAAMGFFFPWYLIYVLGQYHALAVLALALALLGPRTRVAGFLLSAFGKPVLAPAGLVLFARGKWKEVLKIGGLCMLFYVPWLIMRYNVNDGLSFGINHSYFEAQKLAQVYLKFSVFRWNQETGMSKLFDEFMPVQNHLFIRYALAATVVGSAVVLLRKKSIAVCIGVATLWFFMLYGRGHEYHLTLYMPLFLYLYTRRSALYRNWQTVFLAVLTAVPTVYPLIAFKYGIDPVQASNEFMMKNEPVLYWIFLLHRPFLALALFGYILKQEWPWAQAVTEED